MIHGSEWLKASIHGKPSPQQSLARPIKRQLFQALNQLERLQRLRKGDNRDLIGGLPNNELDDWLGFDAIGNSC